MGILNVTPDSFSDGGEHASLEKALEHARRMVGEGARIIDVGGESTRPREPLSEEEELSRVLEVVRALAGEGLCVSIDTRHASVARACLDAGASIVNDVSGFSDPAMVQAVSNGDCGLVVVHMRGEPATMQDGPRYGDVVAEVRDWLASRAEDLQRAGVARDRICVDPGPGSARRRSRPSSSCATSRSTCTWGIP